MSAQEDAAHALEDAVAELRAAIERCPESEWHAVLPNGWTRAATAMHCAMGNDTGTAWIAYLVQGRDILDTPDFNDRMNARGAERNRLASKEEVLFALERSTERATRYIGSLTEEELERTANFAMANREASAARFLGGLGRHIRGHTEQFRAGL